MGVFWDVEKGNCCDIMYDAECDPCAILGHLMLGFPAFLLDVCSFIYLFCYFFISFA